MLDAYAVTALLADEPGAARVQDALRTAKQAGSLLPISAVNWCEVVYVARRATSHGVVSRVVARLDELPLGVVDVDRELAIYAAIIKAEHGLGLGDAFAAALALRLDVPLMTGDPDFLPLRDAGLELEWLG
ncbi:MAG: VapC toxin family PIN domain ribonuclease [Coriobacteriaceae bacterium]|nr:VapC toxin family PIN domain ribonuclease [Coriobacteriaceae bacterium]